MKCKNALKYLLAVAILSTNCLILEASELTLKDAVKVALEKNLDILSAREDIKRSQAGDLVAESALMPSLSIEANYSRQDETHALANEENSYGVTLKATQPIYTGGKATALKKQATHYKQSILSGIKTTEEDVALEISKKFYNILELREEVAAAEDSVTLSENHLEEVKKKAALGVSNKFEVTRAEQQLSSNRTDLITTRNKLESSKIAFFTTLRIAPDGETTIGGTLSFVRYEGDQESSLEKALNQRSELKKALQDIEVQRQEVQVAASGLRPKANINASYMYDDPKDKDGNSDDDWKIALDVEVPLLDRNVTKAQIINEKTTMKQKELALEKQKDQIRSSVVKSWLDLESAEQAVISTKKNLDLAAESLRLSQVGYREGVSTQIDVLDAQVSYTSARKSHATAVSAYNISVASLKKTEGELLSFLQEGDITE